uniref:Uncharacterized protein n=1 Tax=Amphimedon queenslandica TaxID=400682 RepID=A0A1X7STT9_AMPQE
MDWKENLLKHLPTQTESYRNHIFFDSDKTEDTDVLVEGSENYDEKPNLCTDALNSEEMNDCQVPAGATVHIASDIPVHVQEPDKQSQPSHNSTPVPPSFSDLTVVSNMCLDINVESGLCKDNIWTGFKVVGDNLDITVHPRNQRTDVKAKSLHFFQCFTVKDCIDLTLASESPNPLLHKGISELPLDTLLPSLPDDQAMVHNMSVIIGRI